MAYNITKSSSASTIKKIGFVIFVLVCLFIIKNLVTSIYNLWSKQDLVIETREELEKEKKDYKKLKAQLSYVKSDEFIETEARDKLFMVKEGEKGVIVPKNLIVTESKEKKVELPPWKQWINLFF